MAINWVNAAQNGIVVDIGQLSNADKQQLTNAVRKGTISKWRGHWAPLPGASFGMGPKKSCYGPIGMQDQLP